MIKNISVTKKGFAAFGMLALIAITASGIVYERSQVATVSVENNLALVEVMDATDDLKAAVTAQNLALKNFLLTGDRTFVGEIGQASEAIGQRFETLQTLYGEKVAGEGAALAGVRDAWQAWKRDMVERQIGLMRDPMTVDLAKAIELTGAGNAMVADIDGRIDAVLKRLGEAGATASAAQKSALGLVESVSLGAAVVIGLMAALLAFLNFRLVSRPLAELAGVTERLAAGDTAAGVREDERRDEIGRMGSALLVFRENLIRTRALEVEAAEQRRRGEDARKAAMAEVARDLESSVGAIGNEIISASQGLNEMAKSLSKIASGTTHRAMSVSSTSEQTTANVQTVASATEELSASIGEVNDAVRVSSRIAADAVREVERSSAAIAALNSVVDRIGDVTTLINDIAAQTNLLALNATIEAARAGEAGRGFAIVASEVKALAGQTAKATEEIDREISEMKAAANVSMEAAKSAGSLVAEMSERASAIAAAAEQQNAATLEIARNINEAATGTRDVTRSIGEVSADAGRTGSLSADMQSSVEAMFNRASLLGDTVRRFLDQVRAA